MKIEIEIEKCNNYINPFDCGIAKGLRKKLIFSVVSPKYHCGLFLGIIPVFGSISREVNQIAQLSQNKDFKPIKVKIGLYN